MPRASRKQAILEALADELERHEHVVVLGDFNIAPEDRDVHDPEAWHEKILCSTPEREALQRMLDLGLQDTFRLFEQPEGSFSWWDYRAAAFRRNRGLRIDLILTSPALTDACLASDINHLCINYSLVGKYNHGSVQDLKFFGFFINNFGHNSSLILTDRSVLD